MQYIRFLKAPRFKRRADARRGGVVSALITVTSDLGEYFMPQDSPIIGSVCQSNTVIGCKAFAWKAGMRCLEIDIPVDARTRVDSGTWVDAPVVLQVCAGEVTADRLLGPQATVMSVWSAPVMLSEGKAEHAEYVERRLDIGCDTYLSIWEETKHSIALHIWDAGVALVTYLAEVLPRTGKPGGSLGVFDERLQGNQRLNVLELGSGCGIVGLALAQLRRNCNVTLSDLPLAAEISNKNINGHEQVSFRVLDWHRDIPADITSKRLDIILVADCMYNIDAAPALVTVISKLLDPETILCVAHKRRHESEDQFLTLLEESGMELEGRTTVDIGLDIEADGVDLYTMRRT